MSDKIITCKRCGSQFFFTEGEQRFYKSKGLNIPKYCKSCRGKKSEPRGNQGFACKLCGKRGGLTYDGYGFGSRWMRCKFCGGHFDIDD